MCCENVSKVVWMKLMGLGKWVLWRKLMLIIWRKFLRRVKLLMLVLLVVRSYWRRLVK